MGVRQSGGCGWKMDWLNRKKNTKEKYRLQHHTNRLRISQKDAEMISNIEYKERSTTT
jgi:hypothetical protein